MTTRNGGPDGRRTASVAERRRTAKSTVGVMGAVGAVAALTLMTAPGAAAQTTQDSGATREAYPTSKATLLAYFPFDGSGATTEVARGLASEYLSGGGEAPAGLTDGRYGDALYLPGGDELLVPLDIDFNTHPQITVSAWVLMSSERTASGGYILSTGAASDGTPALALYNDEIAADAGRQRLINHAQALPGDQWIHVAAVWDYDAHTVRVHTGDEYTEWTDVDMDPGELTANGRDQSLLDHPEDDERAPARYVVVGAQSVDGARHLDDVALDDLRIYEGAMTPDEIAAIRASATPAPLGRVAAPPPAKVADEDDTATSDDPPEEPEPEIVDWELADAYTLSKVSGSDGSTRRLVDLGQKATMGVLWTEEHNNVPCQLGVRARKGSDRSEDIDECDGTENLGHVRDADLGAGYHTVSLRVCQTGTSNERVKGVTLGGGRVVIDNEAGAIRLEEEVTAKLERANCREPKNVVQCERGQLASGVMAHFNETNAVFKHPDRRQLVGLQLVCRNVEPVYR